MVSLDKRSCDFFQRLFDIVLSLVAIILSSPVWLVIAGMLKLTGDREIFFLQSRHGWRGKPFKILKFSTMKKNSEFLGTGQITLSEDPRILPLGKFLRKSKLNELPQLWNVLVGDLSIIGPRPQPTFYFNKFHKIDQNELIKVRPGISGIGSIIFRDEEKLLKLTSDPVIFDRDVITPYKGQLEHWYVANRSISLYFKLILLTVIVTINPALKFEDDLFRRLPTPPTAISELLNHETVQ